MAVATLVFTGFLLVGAVLAFILVTLPRWLAPREPGELSRSPYECGEVPIGEPWIRFRVAYYIFALIFVVFDVEAVFLSRGPSSSAGSACTGFVEMAVFVGILVLGLAYAWRKGVLNGCRSTRRKVSSPRSSCS